MTSSRAAVAFATIALLVSGCSHKAAAPQASPPLVPTGRATVRIVQPVVSLSGVVAPLQNVTLTSDLVEPAAAVYVNEGDHVSRGQLLATLSTTDLQAQLIGANAKVVQTKYLAQLAIASGSDQVRSAQAGLRQALAALALAQSTLRSDQALVSRGYISQQAFAQQQTQVSTDEQAVTAAQATLSTAIENERVNGTQSQGLQRANVQAAIGAADALRAQIARATILAPVEGVIINRNLNPGEYPGTRQIFTLQQISDVYAALSAFGGQIAGIAKGAHVTLTSPSLPGRRFAASVVAVLSPVSPQSAGFVVKVQIPNPKHALLPGMTVAARVPKNPVQGVAVPIAAFVDDTHQTLITVDGANTAHLTPVQTIALDKRYAVVQGIPSGTIVVANGTLGIQDGQKVNAH